MSNFIKLLEGILTVIGGLGIFVWGYLRKLLIIMLRMLVVVVIFAGIGGLMFSGYLFGVSSGCSTALPIQGINPNEDAAAINWCVDNTLGRHKIILDKYTQWAK